MRVSALRDLDRLAVLHDLAILDTPEEPAFDDIARLASACCRSPIAAVNFVDDGRHWTKAVVGVEGGRGASVSADLSFCAATVASEGGSLSVPDTSQSEEWRSTRSSPGHPFVRFYAGAAIVVSGQPVGVVCVFGTKPRRPGEEDQQALRRARPAASVQLEMRRRNADLRDLALRHPLTGLGQPNAALRSA